MEDMACRELDLHIAVLLRALVPYRRLSHDEAIFYAEQQASVFLKLVHVLEPPVPIERIVSQVGLASIKDDPVQSAPGKSTLDQKRGEWAISLNMNNEAPDRGFVVAHEVKHILDEGFGDELYRPVDVMTTQQRKEHIADYFAACLMTPRPWVERYWKRGMRSVKELATGFGVSPERMGLRLEVLGLPENESKDL